MNSWSGLSVVERPWLRLVLLGCCSLFISTLLVYTLIGPDEAFHLWKVSSHSQKLLAIVAASGYVLISFIGLLARQLLDCVWSDEVVDLESKRFASLGPYSKFFEDYSDLRYGMKTSTFWPRIFLVLPKEVQSAIIESRGSYMASLLFSTTFMWWFRITCPLLCGALAYGALYSTDRLLCATLMIPLLVSFIITSYFNVEIGFLLRRFHFLISLLRLFNRTRVLRFILWMLVGALALKIASAVMAGYAGWNEWMTYWSCVQLGWEKLVTLVLEVVVLAMLAQACQWWFLSAGITYGNLSCSVFDLYRKQLAGNLGVQLSDDILKEQAQWRSHEEFISHGTVFAKPSRSSEQKRSSDKKVTSFKLFWRQLTKDFDISQELIEKSYHDINVEESKLKEAANESFAAAGLLIANEAARAFMIACLVTYCLPLYGLLTIKLSVINTFFAAFLFYTVIPVAAFFVLTISGVALGLRWLVKNQKKLKLTKSSSDGDARSTSVASGIVLALLFTINKSRWLEISTTAVLLWATSHFCPKYVAVDLTVGVLFASIAISGINSAFDFLRIRLLKHIWKLWNNAPEDKEDQTDVDQANQKEENTLNATSEKEAANKYSPALTEPPTSNNEIETVIVEDVGTTIKIPEYELQSNSDERPNGDKEGA